VNGGEKIPALPTTITSGLLHMMAALCTHCSITDTAMVYAPIEECKAD